MQARYLYSSDILVGGIYMSGMAPIFSAFPIRVHISTQGRAREGWTGYWAVGWVKAVFLLCACIG